MHGERIGLFGGTFDPIHNAHLRIASTAAVECGLSRVLLVPAANPPHRTAGTFAGFEDRFRMVELACAGNPLLEASRLEERRQKSYSFDTVERLRATVEDDAVIFFIIGADAFAEITSWHRWKDLAAMVTFAVVGRPGAVYKTPENVCLHPVDGLDLHVSSSEIRAQLAAGGGDVELPPQVFWYIRERGLYGIPESLGTQPLL